jgi:hypothetical protein
VSSSGLRTVSDEQLGILHTFCKELDTIFEVGMLSLPTPIHLGQKDLHALEAAVLLAKLWHHVDFRETNPIVNNKEIWH